MKNCTAAYKFQHRIKRMRESGRFSCVKCVSDYYLRLEVVEDLHQEILIRWRGGNVRVHCRGPWELSHKGTLGTEAIGVRNEGSG